MRSATATTSIPNGAATSKTKRASITSKLSAFIRDPNVTVIVEEINSFRVYFLGEVKSQGVHTFYRPRNWGDGNEEPLQGNPTSATHIYPDRPAP